MTHADTSRGMAKDFALDLLMDLYADTLRGMAKAFMMVGSHERVDTCLAGADALDAVDRVRDAARLIALFEGNASTELWATGRGYFRGRSDAYTHALDLITEALEGDT